MGTFSCPPSSTIAAELPQALALSQALTTSNAAAAAAAVETQYGLTLPALQAVAKQYGIALPSALITDLTPTTAAAQGLVTATLNPFIQGQGPMTTAGKGLAQASAMGIAQVDLGPPGVALVQQLSGGFSGGNKTLLAAGASAANAALTGANSLVGSFAGVGANISAGIAAGMTSGGALALLGAAGATAVHHAKDAANAAAISSSPSKLFADEVGTYLTQGIAVGMTDSTAIRALANAASSVIGAVQTSFGGASSASLATPGVASFATTPSRPWVTGERDSELLIEGVSCSFERPALFHWSKRTEVSL